ncbi:pyridoxal phosphate-dependent aminotransferase [Bacillus sp. ISL-47]|uniref:MalY/PatB family protein n=1 Tax=Bacillus sp. ISL-47 TaxID=2819130 RepID=UPI001BEC3F78|nr:MalY/PatB family protein [Bacillus sp. ISL-47]MBT2689443.1 pyridoxal phosphate-dependent aminotransferase [Bacillus sp. ISL-47]MBT2706383.1 pyridoxal phosphate-dependent aminotransferase [Pseudomonas sp. ISL-84]
MNQFNFHQKIARENTASVKWDMTKAVFGTTDVLPMWVADMDFQPPEEVKKALEERLDHGIFGYTYAPDSTAEAIVQWLKQRHSWEIEKDWILYSTGVVPSIATAIQAFTEKDDKVLLQSPVYTPFFEMIKKNERTVVNSQLKLENGRYEIDFEDFESKLKEGVKLFLLCNPHNPGGRIWTEEELLKIGELCVKYDCIILSDEIHSDLIFKGNKHTPIASLGQQLADITVTCIAPTKTWNLAGIQASAAVISNEQLRKTFQEEQGKQGFFTLSAFGIIGMEAAYRHGEKWLDGLMDYLEENKKAAAKFIKEELPGITMIEPDGTYLLWLDCRGLDMTDEELRKQLLEKGKLALEPGPKYGPGGEGFVRMNIACPHEVLADGLARLKRAFG